MDGGSALQLEPGRWRCENGEVAVVVYREEDGQDCPWCGYIPSEPRTSSRLDRAGERCWSDSGEPWSEPGLQIIGRAEKVLPYDLPAALARIAELEAEVAQLRTRQPEPGNE